MQIILDLTYNGQVIDARTIAVRRASSTTPTVDVDITRLVDDVVRKSVKRIAAKAMTQCKTGAAPSKKTTPTKPKPKGMIKP